MRHDTCHFMIGFSPESKGHFVFRAFHIYIYIYISHFPSFISLLFNQIILLERHRQPCQTEIRPIAIPVIDTTVVLHLFTDLVSIFFISPANVYFILLDLFYTPVITSRTVSLRFCHHVKAMSSASSN